MTHQHVVPPLQQDEIDLLSLLLVLFKAKWVILGAVLVCALAGFAVKTLLPQKWTSYAELIPAQARELAAMNSELNQLALLDIKVNASPGWLIERFVQTYESQIVRREYIAQTDYYKTLAEALSDPLARERLLSSLAQKAFTLKNSQLDQATESKEYTYYRLGVSARSSQEAHALLQGYIDFVAARVVDDLRYNIKNQLDQTLAREKAQYQLTLQRLKNAQQVKIRRLDYSLAVAQAAGISKPLYGNGATFKDDDDFPISLGTNGLRQKLDIERSQTDLSELNAGLKNSQMYIARLSQVHLDALTVQPFKYLMLPSVPVQKEAPKGALIVVLSALTGLLLSCGAALMRHAIVSRKVGSFN
ncbi:enterobactin transporter [Edwardsiella ictaluri]|uniref:LPS O-antigen length regulator Wzz(FepE) n=1 Tax=Edwardsiella ictaluri TaxID=67780 RepID=A0ABY8GEI8_EDWIC|nr:LPS O-antigen length regulator Wzz(fepE) [Edwardsiella ictaluri]KMQ79451.1 enterobactin transporter [Edwardsiella ictaluri]KOO56080.1 enterobactin transporter [Edwardsiella ictaluri]WFN95805.1 LPS O-antigen length regulator Wzz(fepE) [Edwardsiella ictaluri]